MRRLAIVRVGDKRSIVEYNTRDGYHGFLLDGDPRYVKENPAIRPELLTDLGELLPIQAFPRLMQRKVESVYGGIAVAGVTVRHFEQCGSGFLELPVGNITHGWTAFWGEVSTRSVEYTPDGQVQPRFDSIQALNDDLQACGLTADKALAVIDTCVSVEQAGHSQAYIRRHVLDYLLPSGSDDSLLLPVVIYAAYVGLELGSNTLVGDLYRGVDRAYIVLGLLGAGAAWFFLRRRKQ